MELWTFAEEYSGTEDGWNAAVQAVELASWYQRDLLIEDGTAVSRPASQLQLSLGAPPAPGHEVSIRVEVQSGEDWISADDWARATAATLGLDEPLSEDSLGFIKVRKDQLEWVSPHALCAVRSEPLPARVCSQLSFEERTHEVCTELSISGPCRGAREMVFLAHDDDIVGPSGHMVWSPAKGKFEWVDAGISVPEDWTCTHITGLDSFGAEVSCGKFALRVGWEPGQQWIRTVDPSTAMVDRIELVPVKSSSKVPIKTNRSGDIYSRRGKLIAKAGGRTAGRARAPASSAFALEHAADLGAPSLVGKTEKPHPSTGMVLPVEAHEVWTERGRSLRSSVPAELELFLGAAAGSSSYAETIRAPLGPSGTAAVIHHIPTEGASLFLISDQDDPYGWKEILVAPGTVGGSRGQWTLFQIGDAVYLRSMGVHSGGFPQTVTLRWSQGHYQLEAMATGAGAGR